MKTRPKDQLKVNPVFFKKISFSLFDKLGRENLTKDIKLVTTFHENLSQQTL